MSSIVDNASKARRPRDSEATRQALLAAARALFDELGYERATTREIGERADVDPALIARYFDCKEGLYLAAIAEGPVEEGQRVDPDPAAALSLLLLRWEERGQSPIGRAMASPVLSEEVQGQVRTVIGGRVVAPIAEELERRGLADPRLRAELVVALAVGVAVTRANGTLGEVSAASAERLEEALGSLVQGLERG